jgi:hypothetical protein
MQVCVDRGRLSGNPASLRHTSESLAGPVNQPDIEWISTAARICLNGTASVAARGAVNDATVEDVV